MFSYALSEAGAGSDAAGVETRAVRDGGRWVLDGARMWITNAGAPRYCAVMAVTGPAQGAGGVSAFVAGKSDRGVSFGPPEKKPGIKGSPTRAVIFEGTRVPADRMIGAGGAGFRTALGRCRSAR
jgi:alkylation response protein AidB-like acyl-CoA dehydrogenase